MRPVPRGLFVTGTDTEVGKTLVSCGLLQALADQGLSTAGYKPVAAGTEARGGVEVNDDVAALCAASRPPLPSEAVCACLLKAACAPHIAARLEGREISPSALIDGARRLAGQADVVVVEGVGGFCVPLAGDWGTDDLAAELALPVVLVVGLRLGCLNHALLTAQAVRARGLTLAGWVANRIDPRMPWTEDNLATLQARLARHFDAPHLGTVPWLEAPSARAAADCLDVAPLLSRLAAA